MTIRDLLASKGPAVVTVPPGTTVQQAMNELVRHDIGAVVVYDGTIRGILSERDVLRAAAADASRLETARVDDLMTRNVISASPDAELHGVMRLMSERRFRHLPVVENGALSGIISIGDVVNAMWRSAVDENRHLHAYIHGTA
jgi:CBS domain-containing protein